MKEWNNENRILQKQNKINNKIDNDNEVYNDLKVKNMKIIQPNLFVF